MATQGWQIFRQRDFTGGENRKLLPEFLAPNQLILGRNCQMTPDGIVETRPGKTRVNPTSLGSGPILSMFVFAKSDGNNYLVVQHGTTLYYAPWDGESTIGSWYQAKTGLTAGAKLRGAVWKDNLILTNGADSPFRFDGITCTDLGGIPPKSKIIALYASRLWLVDVDNPNFLRFCELEDFDTWDGLNLINIRDGDGDYITNLIPQPGGLLIVKTRSVTPLRGTNRANIRVDEPISLYVGCPSFDGALPVGIMASTTNWFQVSLTGVEPIPDTHSPLLDVIGLSGVEQIVSGVQPSTGKAFFQLPNGITVVFDGKYGAVTTWTGINASCFAAAAAEGYDGRLLIGDTDEGIVYWNDGNDDDGTPIDTVIKLAYSDHDTPQDKVWRLFQPTIEIIDEDNPYEIFIKHDVDRLAISGQQTFAGDVTNYLDFGEDYWGGALWGYERQEPLPYWMHHVRGESISFEIKASTRIKFHGYFTKYRTAGTI
jgi:hypothetical protein